MRKPESEAIFAAKKQSASSDGGGREVGRGGMRCGVVGEVVWEGQRAEGLTWGWAGRCVEGRDSSGFVEG